MRTTLTLAMALCATGCMTQWQHPEWTEERYRTDLTECQSDRVRGEESGRTEKVCESLPDGGEKCTTTTYTSGQRRGLNWKLCMEARGWKRVRVMRGEDRHAPLRLASPSTPAVSARPDARKELRRRQTALEKRLEAAQTYTQLVVLLSEPYECDMSGSSRRCRWKRLYPDLKSLPQASLQVSCRVPIDDDTPRRPDSCSTRAETR